MEVFTVVTDLQCHFGSCGTGRTVPSELSVRWAHYFRRLPDYVAAGVHKSSDRLHLVYSAITMFKRQKSVAPYYNLGASRGRSCGRCQVLDKHILNVCEGIFIIAVAQNVIGWVVLAIAGWEQCNCAGHVNFRGCDDELVSLDNRFDRHCAVLDCRVANMRMDKIQAGERSRCLAGDRAYVPTNLLDL